MSKKTLVLGASSNPERYSYLAMERLKARGHETLGVGRKEMMVNGTPVTKEKMPFENVHTVTLYLNETHQKEYYDYILSLKPQRIIFNPGAENPELSTIARENGIETMEACTLVLLSTNQY